MAELLRLASGVDRSPAQGAFGPRSNEQRGGARAPVSEQNLARLTKVNLFVVGAEDEVARLIASLWPCLGAPVVVRHRGEPLRLSPTAPVGTLVIRDVDTLTPQDQHTLN